MKALKTVLTKVESDVSPTKIDLVLHYRIVVKRGDATEWMKLFWKLVEAWEEGDASIFAGCRNDN